MKILPKINKQVHRYLLKNTINAKYNRNMDAALASGVAAASQIPSLPTWTSVEYCANIVLWTTFANCVKSSIAARLKLSPVIKRAKAMQKAAKIAAKNIDKTV